MPAAVIGLLTTGATAAAAIVIVSGPVPVRGTVLVALSVMTVSPIAAARGMPEMVAPVRVRPAGSAVVAKLVGELVAVIKYVNAVPTVPAAVIGLLMTGATPAVTVRVAGLVVIESPTPLVTTTS